MSQAPRLKSCPYDLHIVVGSGEEGVGGEKNNEKTFYHYYQVLAGWSDYIDVLLSAMPVSNSSTNLSSMAAASATSSLSSSPHRTLRFPDISPETWEKMIRILKPGGTRKLSLEDVVQVLPFYGQYTFQSGVEICDEFLVEQFDQALDRSDGSEKGVLYPLLLQASVISHELKLPLSMEPAIEFCRRAFQGEYSTLEKYDALLRMAVPVILDDETTRDYILHTILQKVEVTEIEDKKGLLTQDDSSLILTYMERFRQIAELEDVLSHIHAPTLMVTNAGTDMVNGHYAEKSWEGFRSTATNNSSGSTRRPGVMAHCWIHLLRVNNDEIEYQGKKRAVDKIIIQASDPFGKKWQLLAAVKLDDGSHAPVTLYTWESDVNSLLPPKTGWNAWSGGSTGVSPAPLMEYSITGKVYVL